LQFRHRVGIDAPVSKLVFDHNSRHFAALTDEGRVQVFKLRKETGYQAHWALDLKGVRAVERNEAVSNQFFVLANKEERS